MGMRTNPAMAVLAALLAGAVVTATPATAGEPRQVHYVGIHPIPKAEGGGLCYIEGPHVHLYDADRVQYRDHRGANYFVGDPVAYGYDGKRYAYKGHHPIYVHAVVGDDDPDEEYCYLDGPHYHYFAPPSVPEFKVVGDTYFYVGQPPRAYVEARPQHMRINAVYQPIVYERPAVAVAAPVGWIGARAEFAVATPAVVVEPPRAAVGVGVGVGVLPVAGVHVEVGVGLPGVVVHERAPAVIVHERPVIIHERPVIIREHHDHGRHRGHR